MKFLTMVLSASFVMAAPLAAANGDLNDRDSDRILIDDLTSMDDGRTPYCDEIPLDYPFPGDCRERDHPGFPLDPPY